MRTIALALAALLGCAPLCESAHASPPDVPPEKAAQPIGSVRLMDASAAAAPSRAGVLVHRP